MEKIVALVRVSTDKQTVENQEFAIKQKYPNTEIIWFREDDTSGTKSLRIDQYYKMQSRQLKDCVYHLLFIL